MSAPERAAPDAPLIVKPSGPLFVSWPRNTEYGSTPDVVPTHVNFVCVRHSDWPGQEDKATVLFNSKGLGTVRNCPLEFSRRPYVRSVLFWTCRNLPLEVFMVVLPVSEFNGRKLFD
jgi:hypothetical protein